jgi:hypothetical protein
MTFQDWQASKKLVGVEHEEVSAYPFADDTEHCWLYPGGLIIECRPEDRYLLALPMEEEISEDLPWLERRLYDFGRGEGSIPV